MKGKYVQRRNKRRNENIKKKVIKIIIERNYDFKFIKTKRYVFKYLTKILEGSKNVNSTNE